MYYPYTVDEFRVRQEELRRRADASRWAREAIDVCAQGQRRSRLGRWVLRLAFTDTAMRPMPTTCVNC